MCSIDEVRSSVAPQNTITFSKSDTHETRPRYSSKKQNRNSRPCRRVAQVLTGSVVKIEDKAEDAAAREAYLASHPGAFWANFGDFGMYRMDAILDISFVGQTRPRLSFCSVAFERKEMNKSVDSRPRARSRARLFLAS